MFIYMQLQHHLSTPESPSKDSTALSKGEQPTTLSPSTDTTALSTGEQPTIGTTSEEPVVITPEEQHLSVLVKYQQL